MVGIIGFVCAAALAVLILFIFGDYEGGNTWIDIYKEIKKKTRRR